MNCNETGVEVHVIPCERESFSNPESCTKQYGEKVTKPAVNRGGVHKVDELLLLPLIGFQPVGFYELPAIYGSSTPIVVGVLKFVPPIRQLGFSVPERSAFSVLAFVWHNCSLLWQRGHNIAYHYTMPHSVFQHCISYFVAPVDVLLKLLALDLRPVPVPQKEIRICVFTAKPAKFIDAYTEIGRLLYRERVTFPKRNFFCYLFHVSPPNSKKGLTRSQPSISDCKYERNAL